MTNLDEREGAAVSGVAPGVRELGTARPRATGSSETRRDDGLVKVLGLLGGMSWESTVEYYRVDNLTGTDVTEVRTDLAAAAGGGDASIDSVVVNGTAGDDTVTVVDSGADVVVQGLAAAVRIAHAAPTSDRLTVNGLAGNDAITATPGAGALIVLDLVP